MPSPINCQQQSIRSRVHQLWADNRHPKRRERMLGAVVIPILTGQNDKLTPYALKMKDEIKATFEEMICRTRVYREAISLIDNVSIFMVGKDYSLASKDTVRKALAESELYDQEIILRIDELWQCSTQRIDDARVVMNALRGIKLLQKDKARLLLEYALAASTRMYPIQAYEAGVAVSIGKSLIGEAAPGPSQDVERIGHMMEGEKEPLEIFLSKLDKILGYRTRSEDLKAVFAARNISMQKLDMLGEQIREKKYEEALKTARSIPRISIKSVAMLKLAASLFDVDPQVGCRDRDVLLVQFEYGKRVRNEARKIEKREEFIVKEQSRSGLSRESIISLQKALSERAKMVKLQERIKELETALAEIKVSADDYDNRSTNDWEKNRAVLGLFEKYYDRGDMQWTLSDYYGPIHYLLKHVCDNKEEKGMAAKHISEYGCKDNAAYFLAACSMANAKSGEFSKALKLFNQAVSYLREKSDVRGVDVTPLKIALNFINRNLKSSLDQLEKEVTIKTAQKQIALRMKKNGARQETVKLLLDNYELDQVFNILGGLAPEHAATLLKMILNQRPKLIRDAANRIKELIAKNNLAISDKFLQGIKDKLEKQEWEAFVQSILSAPSPLCENQDFDKFLDQAKNDGRLKETLARALREYVYDPEEYEQYGVAPQINKILSKLVELDRKSADENILWLFGKEPKFLRVMRAEAREFFLDRCNNYYKELKDKFVADLMSADKEAGKRLWREWNTIFMDDLASPELRDITLRIVKEEKDKYAKIAEQIVGAKERYHGMETAERSEKFLIWFKEGFPGMENGQVDWALADTAISSPEEALMKMARKSAEVSGEDLKEYDLFLKKLTLAQKLSARYNLSLPMAYYLASAVREGYPNNARPAFKILKKVLAAIPGQENLDDISVKYPAIPIDTLFLCMAYHNGTFYMDRLLNDFNIVFSAKKIKDSINKKLAIKKALLNIYLNGDHNNKKAVAELLLLVEKDFGKTQHNSFVESLQHIETISAFSDMVKMVEEKTKQISTEEDE